MIDEAAQEQRIAQIEATQARTTANLETVSSDLIRLTQVVESLRDSVLASGRTQWGVVGTWVAVMMAIGTAVIAPQMMDIREVKESVRVLSAADTEEARSIGVLEERIKGVEENFASKFQRNREEIDWVWDLMHSRFGYRDPQRQRFDPNK